MQIIVFHPCSEAALVPCCYNLELIFIFYYKYFTHLVSHIFFTIDVISKGIINVHLNKTSFFLSLIHYYYYTCISVEKRECCNINEKSNKWFLRINILLQIPQETEGKQ